jgi:hypothetical protein
MCCGSSRKAAKLLKEAGGPRISEATLRGWLTIHKSQYDRIRAEAAPTLQAMRAEKFEAAADLKHEAAILIASRLVKAAERGEIPPARLASSLKDLSISTGIDIDKSLLLKGQPTTISERRSPEELLRRLRQLGVIEGDAEEMPAPALEEK